MFMMILLFTSLPKYSPLLTRLIGPFSFLVALVGVTVIDSVAVELKYGSLEGSIQLHQEQNMNNSEPDSGFLNGLVELKYQTDHLYNFSANVGMHGGFNLWAMNEDDGQDAQGELLSQLNVAYENDTIQVILGRQELEMLWLEDYHEALRLSYQPFESLGVRGGYSTRFAEADVDGINDFENIGDHGIWFLELHHSNDRFPATFSPYLLHIRDVHTAYGATMEISQEEHFRLVFGYGFSDSNNPEFEDGFIANTELGLYFNDLQFGGGYIQTDKTGGSGSLDLLGDRINPLEEGNLIFEPDARTPYAIIGYSQWGVDCSMVFAKTETGELSETEFNLNLAYQFADSFEPFSIEFLYAIIDSGAREEDYNKFFITLIYEF